MSGTERASVGDDYVLATGDEGVARLHLLDEVYGASSRAACTAAGLAEGWRVADIGCGVGDMSCWFGACVGPVGGVTAMDVSADQLAHGRLLAERRGLGNVSFVEGSVYEPDLPPGGFDLVFCRFLLCHLQRPADALGRMAALLRPGGALVVQDMVISSMFSDPAGRPYGRFIELAHGTSAVIGVDYDVARRLFGMFGDAGLTDVSVSVHQPAFSSGERKRLWEYTFLEASPGFAKAGVATEQELADLATQLASISGDDCALVVQPALFAVSGVVSGGRED